MKKIMIIAVVLAALTAAVPAGAALTIKGGSFADAHSIEVEFLSPLSGAALDDLDDPSAWRVVESSSPDIALPLQKVELAPANPNALRLIFRQNLDKSQTHRVSLSSPQGSGSIDVTQNMLAVLLTLFLSAAVINNYVFSRYLGLCVFFGVSQHRDTAVGTGITFTLVMTCSGILSWAVFQFILKPLSLGFLQILVFIGLVACLVQALDTILRKINPVLFKKLGVYLVLITVNCIILAVPLMIADRNFNLAESFFFAVGAGLGFALALYLMANVRERLAVARVPASFQGLPIAFIVCGLFALAFMGFSGLSLF
jgi:electron transport complex protein RnfA